MSDIKIQPSATGSATVTLTAPATGTARTVTLPDSTGELLSTAGGTMTGDLTIGSVGSVTSSGSDLKISGTDDIFFNVAGASDNILQLYGNNSSNVNTQTKVASPFYPFADNSYDLGNSTERWKDLYLSGGLKVGGTGSANTLDDYEEGTWTPTAGGGLTGLTKTDCFYTKIGNMVHLQGRVSGFTGINSSTLYFGGLPFNPQYSTSNALVATTFVDLDQGYQLWCHLSHGEPKIYFRYMMNNAQYSSLAGSDVSSSSNMYFNATYTVA